MIGEWSWRVILSKQHWVTYIGGQGSDLQDGGIAATRQEGGAVFHPSGGGSAEASEGSQPKAA